MEVVSTKVGVVAPPQPPWTLVVALALREVGIPAFAW